MGDRDGRPQTSGPRPCDIDSTEAQKQRELKVLDLLQNPNAKYDDHHAMVLAQIFDFKPGILYLYEKAKQYQQIGSGY